MAAMLHLELFDDDPGGQREATQRAQPELSYEEGYVAGLAAAEAAFAADQSTLKTALIDALRAAETGYDNARSDLVVALQPLHEAMISVLLPQLVAPALHARLCALLADATQKDCARPLVVRVPVGQAEVMQTAIAESDLSNVTFAEDAALGPNAVRLVSAQSETALDLDAAIEAIAAQMEVFTILTGGSGKVTTHG